MRVTFQATIKVDETQNWYIELTDLLADKTQHCLTMEEFEIKIEEFSQGYGGHVDEIKWLKDDDVLPSMMDAVRVQMANVRAKIENEKGGE